MERPENIIPDFDENLPENFPADGAWVEYQGKQYVLVYGINEFLLCRDGQVDNYSREEIEKILGEIKVIED